jgi:hypothetical protein
MAQLGVLEVKVSPDLEGFGSQVSGAMKSIGSGMANLASTVGRDLAGIGASVAAGGVLAIGAMATIGVKAAAQIETAELQFETLLGSADKASKKVDELFDFAKKTPFEASEVIAASRQLQIFGEDALNTSENLTMIGDAAAATSMPIQDVSFWVGRAYALMQAGKPWGEAAMRLQEMGILSQETRGKVEGLAEAGASGSEQWEAFSEGLGRFDGAMEKLAGTWEGLTSNIKDMITLGLADIFTPTFESLKKLMDVVVEFSGTTEWTAIAAGIGALLAPINNLFADAADGLASFTKSLDAADILTWFDDARSKLREVGEGFQFLYDSVEPIVPVLAGVAAAFASSYLAGIPLFGMLFTSVSPVTGLLLGFVFASEEAQEALARFGGVIIDIARSVLPQLTGPLDSMMTSLGEGFSAALDALTPGIEALAVTLLPALARGLAGLLEPLGQVMGDLGSMTSDVLVVLADALAPIVEDLLPRLGEAFADVTGPLAEIVAALRRLTETDIVQGIMQVLVDVMGELASAAGDVLGAGLGLIADAIGLIADHASIAIPLIGGMAAAFGAFKAVQAGGLLDDVVLRVMYLGDGLKKLSWGNLVQGAKDAVGALGGLGGVLAGGLLTVGFVAGIKGLTDYFSRLAQETQQNQERVKGLSALLGDLGRNADTAGQYLNNVATGEWGTKDWTAQLQALQTMGVDIDTLTAAMDGNKSAWEAIDDQVTAFAESGKITEEQAKLLYGAFGNLDEGVDGSNQILRIFEQTLSDMGVEFETTAAGAETYKTATERAAEKTQALSTETSNLKYQFDTLYASQLNAAESALHIEEGFTRIAEAAKTEGAVIAANTGLIDTSNSAGQAWLGSLQSQVQGIWDYTEAQVRGGASTEEATRLGMAQRDQLIETMLQTGLSREAVERYFAQWGLNPKSVKTAAEAETAAANQDLDNLQNNIASTDPSVTTTAYANTAQADSSINITQSKLEQLDGYNATATVNVQASIDRLLTNVFPGWGGSATTRGVPMFAGDVAIPGGLAAPTGYADAGNVVGTVKVPLSVGGAAVRIENAQFNEPADFDTLINRVNLALAAGRL